MLFCLIVTNLAGDASFAPGQLIIAASEGSRAAVGVNMYLTLQEFLTS
jgi:hypothetical protein